MDNWVYDKGKHELAIAGASLASADLRVMLMKSSHVANKGTHQFVADIVADELTVSGYARSALANKTVTKDTTLHITYLDADDQVFTALAAGQTLGFAVLFRHTGSDATAPLLSKYDVPPFILVGGNVTIVWSSAANGGVLKLGD